MRCSISNYLGGFSGYFSVTTQLIPLSGSIYYMISVLLRLLRCILWPQTWSLMASISCELEKNVFSALVGWGSLQALTTSSCLMKFWVQTRPCRLPACWIFLFLAEERRSLQLPSQSIPLSLAFGYFLPLLLGCPVARRVQAEDCYVLLKNWPRIIM